MKEHPKISKTIAEAGAEFIEEHLTMDDVTCYWDKLLRGYTSLLQYQVEKDPKLILVKP